MNNIFLFINYLYYSKINKIKKLYKDIDNDLFNY